MELLRNVSTGRRGLEGEVFFPLFGRYIGFHADEDAGIEDVQRCALHLNALPERVTQALCAASIRYCESYCRDIGEAAPAFAGQQAVLSSIEPRTLIVPGHQGREETVVHLELDCEWEEEHGMAWLIRGDRVFYVGPFCSLNPWRMYDPDDTGYANIEDGPEPAATATLEGATLASPPPHETLALPDGLKPASEWRCLHQEPDMGEIWSAEMDGRPYWIVKTADAVYGYQKSDAPERRVVDIIEESWHRLGHVLSAGIDPARIGGLRIEPGVSRESVARLADHLGLWLHAARERLTKA